jgi:hypothetical protein
MPRALPDLDNNRVASKQQQGIAGADEARSVREVVY